MHVRCPHCKNPIEVVNDSTLAEVSCPTCGSSFSLAGEDPDEKVGQFLARQIRIEHPDVEDAIAHIAKQVHWTQAMRDSAVAHVQAAMAH